MRDNGGHAVALRGRMPNVYGVAARRRVLGGLRRRLGRRPLLHRLRAAARRLHDDPVRGQAGRHARRRRVLAGGRRARRATCCSPRRRRSGRSRGRTRRRAASAATTSPRSARCSWPASGSTRTPTTGRRDLLGVPVIDHWWQTETGWPIAANLRRARAAADQARLADACRCRATTCGCSTPAGGRCRAGRRGRDRDPAAAAAGHACRRCGSDDERFVASYLSALPRPLPDRGRRPRRRGRLPVRDGPHRRRDQRRRAPALDRGDGGGAGGSPGRSPSAP